MKSFCFHKARCVKCAEDHPIINCLYRKKSKDVKCEGKHSADYKSCMVYKDNTLEFFHITDKMITLKSQPWTQSTSMQIKLVQSGKSYASVTRTEDRQPITTQNNQKT
jgi:uncharacterized membrane protein